jgi:hypothetical protein
MLKRHTVTLNDVVTGYDDMFDHMNGMMRAMARSKTPSKEDLFFAVKFDQQKVFKFYT